ncbi:Crp/Fnr family transcriptional regulator [Celerinatantimonas sp. MCCC 1A17872]|uniref:Crp/Fnr family transcriptional regulator n=1 Tax=Celerinatantimonas sp. MCCC 1A17872 TaxID=3177514 RepID=UPI0038C3810E
MLATSQNSQQWYEYLEHGREKTYPAHSIICTPKQEDNRVFVMRSGQAKICLYGAAREQTLGFLAPPSLYVTHTPVWVEAITECSIKSWPIQQIMELFKADPSLSIRVISEIGKLLSHAIEMIEDFAFRNVESRLARYLVFESQRCGEGVVQLPGNTETLASLLGTSRQTLSTILSRMAKQGWITRVDAKHIQLRDIQQLSQLVDPLSSS